MPQQSVAAVDADGTITKAVLNPDVTCRSLSALFRLPKPHEARDIRPTELIYRAWHLFEFDLPLLRERKFLIDGNIVRGCDLSESQLRNLGQQLLLGVRQSRQPVVRRRTDVLTKFRATSGSLTAQIEARLGAVLTYDGQRVCLPADPEARSNLLAQWLQQSSTEKSLTFLQWPPQSLRDEFASLPQEQQTGDLNPCVNTAIEGHETVAVEPCLMQATTVTRAMYAVFDQRFLHSTIEPDWGDGNLQQTLEARASAFDEYDRDDEFPILCTNWYDAWVFCKWLGPEYRLPTELTWEHACRAGTASLYHFGNGLNGEQANCNGNYPHGTDKHGTKLGKGPYLERTTPVGCDRYACNDYGLFDMHGNAWEWCEERYNASNDAPGSSRVLRGGSWRSGAGLCRSADRDNCSPGRRRSRTGFRVCRG